ncbi:transporter substrate-binding domain-containing protein [Tatumella citrea]|uniref:Restriction endonuclease n=1 Tax=Tatumella citrea TaxID=53336 RepID=A0A1Y0LCF3_TATCI|nr:transporter substrate-binding domain-containing protein [Tatumella citrea]ARU95349.1 restriction endonuclease [Tatumella citrea]ARU99390.1 restriction endonuclease [Tatumella citrea]
MAEKTIIAELAPKGRLRVAINYGNPVLAQQGEAGQPKGISAKLAGELAQELNLAIEWVEFDAAGRVFATVDDDCWDIAFLAIDPLRSEKIAFSQPYVTIAGTYLVRASSDFQQVADLDQQGVTVSIERGAAYDLFLSRQLQHAEIKRVDTASLAIEAFMAREADAVAGLRYQLQAYAQQNSDFRLPVDDFTSIHQAMAVPRQRTVAAGYVGDFIIRKKREGFVKAALVANGQPGSLAAE